MCLGIPGRVVELVDGYADQIALVDVVGKARKINVGMLENPVAAGDWVLIHLGFAVEIIDQENAEAALSGLELMGRERDGRPEADTAPAAVSTDSFSTDAVTTTPVPTNQ